MSVHGIATIFTNFGYIYYPTGELLYKKGGVASQKFPWHLTPVSANHASFEQQASHCYLLNQL